MAITLEVARKKLQMWLDAEDAVATGQSYKIGTRSLTRANLPDIMKQISYWEKRVEQLESGTKGMKVFCAVPRDF